MSFDGLVVLIKVLTNYLQPRIPAMLINILTFLLFSILTFLLTLLLTYISTYILNLILTQYGNICQGIIPK